MMLTEHHEILGLDHQHSAAAPVEFRFAQGCAEAGPREHREEGREHTARRHSAFSRLATRQLCPSVVSSPFPRRLEPPLAEREELPIPHSPRHPLQASCVRDFLAIPGDLGVDDLGMVWPERGVDLAPSGFRTALGAIPRGGVSTLRRQARLQPELGRPLCHPVTDRRNASWSFSDPAGLGDQYPPHRQGTIAFGSPFFV